VATASLKVMSVFTITVTRLPDPLCARGFFSVTVPQETGTDCPENCSLLQFLQMRLTISEPTSSLSVCSACATACRSEPARVTILMLGHCIAVQKRKSPGAPRALPLERRLLGIALADQIAAQ